MFIRCHPSYIFQTTLNFVPNNTNQTARNVSGIFNLTRELTCFFLFLVNNKGISGVLILLMFLWQSLFIHGQKCMKGRKDILEAFPCNLGNSFFAKKKKKVCSIQKLLKLRALGEEIQELCYTSLPLFHRTLRNGDKV